MRETIKWLKLFLQRHRKITNRDTEIIYKALASNAKLDFVNYTTIYGE